MPPPFSLYAYSTGDQQIRFVSPKTKNEHLSNEELILNEAKEFAKKIPRISFQKANSVMRKDTVLEAPTLPPNFSDCEPERGKGLRAVRNSGAFQDYPNLKG